MVIELILANHYLNLSRREADVAVRLTNEPPQTLVGRRICAAGWCVYCRKDVLNHLPRPPINAVPFVGFADGFGPLAPRRWIETHVPPGRIIAQANTKQSILGLALQGFAALLPCFIGDSEPALDRIQGPQRELDVGLWILTHSDLRRSPRVRAFMDFAGAEFMKQRRAIAGADGDDVALASG